ncbi:MAG: hypothetical protein ACI33S_03885 [Bacilli bacterium]
MINKYRIISLMEYIFNVIKSIFCLVSTILCIEYGYLFYINKSIFLLLISVVNCIVGSFFYLSIKNSNKIIYNCHRQINSIKRGENYAKY